VLARCHVFVDQAADEIARRLRFYLAHKSPFARFVLFATPASQICPGVVLVALLFTCNERRVKLTKSTT
jgi:hypothetical protein